MTRTYIPPKCSYSIEGSRIKTDGSVKNKVTGTALAGILNESPWSSPFQQACALLGLCREDISNKPAVKVGVALEGRIIDYLGQKHHKDALFLKAEEVYALREGDHDKWKSDWDDEIFAGHLDGVVMDDDGCYVLEIKTSGSDEGWENGMPPRHYMLQVGLYSRYAEDVSRDKVYVGLGIRDEDTYKNPSAWVPSDANVKLFEVPIDQEQVGKDLEKVKEWYAKYIEKGVTPDYDPSNPGDVEMWEYLTSLAEDVDTVRSLVDQYRQMDADIKAREAEFQDLADARDAIKNRIKEYMDIHDMKQLESADGGYYMSLSERKSSKIDPELLRADGIDPEKYTVYTVSKSISLKERK